MKTEYTIYSISMTVVWRPYKDSKQEIVEHR